MRRIPLLADLLVFVTLLVPMSVARTQQTTPDSLRLPALRAAALATDPRGAQLELLATQSALRLSSISAEARPSLTVDARSQYQSDVASIPVVLPGVTLPTPPRDTYDARLTAQQRIYDPSLGPRRAVERAQLEESQARVRAALYNITDAVNSAFFTALRAQSQAAEMETVITDLTAQLSVTDSRVRSGAALRGESNALQAEILRRRQTLDELQSMRRTALAVLSNLTGRTVGTNAPLAAPDLEAEVAAARLSIGRLRARPEYEQFARSQDVLDRLSDVRTAQDRPRISAFAGLGYGRPGLRFLSDRFDSYWLTGIQFQWTPWNWGATRRDREINALQRRILVTEEQAFTAALARAVENDLASLDRLAATLAQDDQIVALREDILAETRARHAESIITSAEYVDRQTDVLAARLSRALHRVELSQARANLLATLGIEVR